MPQPLRTSQGWLCQKQGCLLRLESPDHARSGWGEAAALEGDTAALAAAIARCTPESGTTMPRAALEALLPKLPEVLAFAIGAALAELDGMIGPIWLPPPPAALLLPAGEEALGALERHLNAAGANEAAPLCCKWKVAASPDPLERQVLEQLLERLPADARLRLDANGGWSRATATAWAKRLAEEPRLEWLEQPLEPFDLEGHEALARLLPVALDESLQRRPELRQRWPGWQVRRPSQEGDPRPLLAALAGGAGVPVPPLVFSTAFETGIGQRWLGHLAALQARQGDAPAPGLAPGWLPGTGLGRRDPEEVWEAAAR
ncbi:o-succinylbenzoate synthase [Synechococcus sp. CS-1328]|uniref:o-succinylbenzoate synthase n=1 Tax=Synechococcus sp. CS-1328 TaxID=2847976 RepID=UPI00223C4233|nr:o-succinylbenzoate synthase [Synechococcus sp. CS-1328]